jgi:hypothetical protein
MRGLLTSTALMLALLVAGAGWAQESTGGGTGSSERGTAAGEGGGQGTSSGESNEQGGTTGLMTTSPQSKSDDAVGTRGETMEPECPPGQTPTPGQKC